MHAIKSKIVGYKVINGAIATVTEPVGLHEGMSRPEKLQGTTYKLSPVGGSSVYLTINNVEVGGKQYPYEIFLATKDVEHQAWMAAITRLVSAVFRKGGEVKFIAEELKMIHDPKGGYFVKGHGYVPSVIAHIGLIIEQHLEKL